jgi:hypothetical protein
MKTGGRGAIQDEANELSVISLLQQMVNNTLALDFINKLLQVDEEGNTTYIGYADAGTPTNGANWAIKKIVITNTNGCDADITWADGNTNFDNVWDNRASLTYS